MAKDYDISRPAGQCSKCERQIEPGEEFIATVKDADEALEREDFCLGCWDGDKGGNWLGFWRAKAANPQEKKKLFIDDELLVNFFERLENAEEPAKINFRFVLSLVLMRKKLLVYDRSNRREDAADLWDMHFKGSDETVQVVDPHMDAEKIAQVSGQLGQIMEGEL